MSQGWVRLYRKMKDTSFYDDEGLLKMAIHCLLTATHRPRTVVRRGESILLEPGQFLTGRYELAEAVKMKPSTAWKRLQRLSERPHEFVTCMSDTRKTLVTVCRWQDYQPEQNEGTGERDKKVTAKEQPDNTHNNNGNNGKKTSIDLPPWIPKKEWGDWVAHRRAIAKGGKVSVQTLKVNLRKLEILREQGYDPAEVINQTVASGWKGFYPLKEGAIEPETPAWTPPGIGGGR